MQSLRSIGALEYSSNVISVMSVYYNAPILQHSFTPALVRGRLHAVLIFVDNHIRLAGQFCIDGAAHEDLTAIRAGCNLVLGCKLHQPGTRTGGSGQIPHHTAEFVASHGIGLIKTCKMPRAGQSLDQEAALLIRNDAYMTFNDDITGDGTDGVGSSASCGNTALALRACVSRGRKKGAAIARNPSFLLAPWRGLEPLT